MQTYTEWTATTKITSRDKIDLVSIPSDFGKNCLCKFKALNVKSMTGKQISESDCIEDFGWPSSITSIRTGVESPECDDNSENDALNNDSF